MEHVGDDYRVNLDIFEGPLDLLLYLIKKNDLDIYDIPVAIVLEEYMRYVDTLQELNIDLAGEFLLMAAELAHIKSRLLLPDESAGDEMEDEDPRSDLIRRLLEYQQFKDASEELLKRQMLCRDVFTPQMPERVVGTDDGPLEGSVYELIEAFSNILKKMPEDEFHDVTVDRISVNERIYQIIGMIKEDATATLDEILGSELHRYNVVVTFLALLEMSRLRMIKVYQSAQCGPIYVQRTMEDVSEDEMSKLISLDTRPGGVLDDVEGVQEGPAHEDGEAKGRSEE